MNWILDRALDILCNRFWRSSSMRLTICVELVDVESIGQMSEWKRRDYSP